MIPNGGVSWRTTPKRYAEWISFVFDRPTQRRWYFEFDYDDFETPAAALLDL
jgi:hypothetical protein